MKTALVALAIAGAAVSSATAQVTLAEWTFETSLPTNAGPHVAEGGINAATSQALGFHANGSTVWSNPVGNGSAESFSSNFWTRDDYYQFTTSTAGYQSITLSFDQTSSGTGPTSFAVLASTDNFATFSTLVASYSIVLNTTPNPVWNSGTRSAIYSLGPIAATAAFDNQAAVSFRLVSLVTPSNTAGTNRVDNVKIEGTLIPAPGALALVGLGGLVAARRRRA
jgi:hypothetical protein